MAAQPPEFQVTLDHAHFRKPEDLDGESRPTIGGKANGLFRLHAAGAPVPAWVVLPTDAAICFHPEDADSELDVLFAALSPNGEGVAVRSSGLSEDQSIASAAGIYETLFCTKASELPEALNTVLNSARTARASVYRADIRPSAMAVIIQRCITPILSGVAFSAHPSRARYDRVLIEVVHGDCGALVDGSATPSRFEVDIESGTITHTEAGAQGPDEIDAALATALLGWLLRLEDAFDAALDIEWATDASGLWLLQARPISRLALDPALRPPVPATSWFFDQRFHEPIHPITRTSLLPLILRTGIEDALRLRGTAEPSPLYFDYGGQCYVNFEAYQRLLRDVPRRQLTPDFRQLFPNDSGAARLPGLGLLRRGISMIWWERRLALGNMGTWNRFRDGLSARLAEIPAAPVDDAKRWNDAWHRLDALTEEFLKIHRWSIVLADYAYNAFLLLTRLLPKKLRTKLRENLLRKVRLVTAEANRARETVRQGDEDAMEAFLRAYGHRSASLDYAAPTWAEIPIQGGIKGATESTPTEPRTSRKILVRLLEMREEQRFHWERILARQRAMLLYAGRALKERNLLTDANEIWWLEWDELQRALTESLAPESQHIAQRRRAHRINVPAGRPTHITPGQSEPVYETDNAKMLRGVGASSGTARGTACVVRQLKYLPEAIPEGCILVLPCLDPAWTPIMRHVAGLVIERGGLLSHAAIIAREYGIPLVIGVPEATEQIRTGDEIDVDGDWGMVQCE